MNHTSDGSTADYYKLPEGATELQDLISHRNMNAQIGEVFRACYRYGLASHSDSLRDAKKILFYAQAEVKRLEKAGGLGAGHSLPPDYTDGKWHEWDGGRCPVPGDFFVDCVLRNGGADSWMAKDIRWTNEGSRGDIIYFRVVK